MARRSGRPAIRLAARYLVFLAFIHTLFLYVVANESPAWFNTTAYLNELTARFGISVTKVTMGIILLGLTLLIAFFLWRKSSKIAALIFAVGAGWELYWRFWQLNYAFENQFFPSWLMLLGATLAAASFFVAIGALVGTLRR